MGNKAEPPRKGRPGGDDAAGARDRGLHRPGVETSDSDSVTDSHSDSSSDYDEQRWVLAPDPQPCGLALSDLQAYAASCGYAGANWCTCLGGPTVAQSVSALVERLLATRAERTALLLARMGPTIAPQLPESSGREGDTESAAGRRSVHSVSIAAGSTDSSDDDTQRSDDSSDEEFFAALDGATMLDGRAGASPLRRGPTPRARGSRDSGASGRDRTSTSSVSSDAAAAAGSSAQPVPMRMGMAVSIGDAAIERAASARSLAASPISSGRESGEHAQVAAGMPEVPAATELPVLVPYIDDSVRYPGSYR